MIKGKNGNIYKLEPIGSLDKKTWSEIYAHWVNDPEVTKYLYQGTIPTSTEKCEQLYDTLTNDNNVVFNIWHPVGFSEPMVGIVGIFDIYWPSRIGEFRILIGDKEHWGNSIGKKTLAEMNKIAFDRLGLHKFWLGFNASHKGAEKAYSDVGHKYECLIKQHHYKNGQYNDLIRLCMFRKDYEEWLENTKQA